MLLLEERLILLGEEVKKGNMTWKEVADILNREFGENLSKDAVRKRFYVRDRRNGGEELNTEINGSGEYETIYENGMVEAQKVVEYSKEVFGDKRKMLEYLGYNPDEWEFVFLTTSMWNQHTKEQVTKQLYAVKFKIKPVVKTLSLDKALECAKEVFKREIKPFKFKKEKEKKLNDELLVEIPAIELHLGKYAENLEVGQDYNIGIAKERFYNILERVISIQDITQADRCVVMIGNDFFNSDTVGNTTTKGTQQFNDVRWKNLFINGLEMYQEFLITLRDNFNHVDVRLCQGNHDVMSSFYLYMALSAFFANDEIVEFSENYKEYQCYTFGDNAIFFGHGDCNIKRLVASIPAEFYKEWGETKFHELHLGHLHSQIAVDEQNGMIMRRISSPTAPDAWHYSERFIGAVPNHQVFIWHKSQGLKRIEYISFEKDEKNVLTLKK